ncbi:MAG: methionine synthase I (cobalamin-dependent), partial [Myxococcota bacterium]
MSDHSPTIQPGRDSFQDFLDGEGVALLDGAMGTMLYSRGAFIHRAFEELNVSEPGMVREIHAAYLAAGADIIETNTFAANRFRLSPHGLEKRVEELNRAGVARVREAAGGRAWIAGAMGPLGVRIEPFGAIGRDEAREVFRQQAAVLEDEAVDLFLLETFSHLPELLEAIAAIREVSQRPIVAEMRVTTGAVTPEGVDVAEVARAVELAGANVVGVNCCEALAALDALGEMHDSTSLPLVGQPNAGGPRSVGGRNLYLASADYLVAWGRRAVRNGARLLGGCCGTRPEHIRALREAVGQAHAPAANTRVRRAKTRPPAAPPVPLLEKSPLATALSRGSFPLGVSFPPSRGHGSRDITRAARQLKLAGVDFVSLPEGTGARAHAPPIVLAGACRQAGILPVVEYSCRGRRIERIQSDLIGASMLGVETLVLVTGDPLNPGAEQDAWPDLEIDSIGAMNLAVRLNHGEDIGGNAIGQPTAFH